MDQRKLRDCFGLFATGVIIACARRNNFLAEKFFNNNLFDGKKLGDRLLNNKIFGKKLAEIFTDEFFGMTINSFSSVSLQPPLISFCIDNKSSNLSLFKKNHYFSLNILGENQKDLASGFAKPRNSDKWQIENYTFGKFGNPIFDNSIGFLECKKHKIIKIGDHHMVIGEVVDCGKISNAGPLIYNKAKFSLLK